MERERGAPNRTGTLGSCACRSMKTSPIIGVRNATRTAAGRIVRHTRRAVLWLWTRCGASVARGPERLRSWRWGGSPNRTRIARRRAAPRHRPGWAWSRWEHAGRAATTASTPHRCAARRGAAAGGSAADHAAGAIAERAAEGVEAWQLERERLGVELRADQGRQQRHVLDPGRVRLQQQGARDRRIAGTRAASAMTDASIRDRMESEPPELSRKPQKRRDRRSPRRFAAKNASGA